MDNKNSSSYSRSSHNGYSSSNESGYNLGEFHMGPVEPKNVDNFGPCGIRIRPK